MSDRVINTLKTMMCVRFADSQLLATKKKDSYVALAFATPEGKTVIFVLNADTKPAVAIVRSLIATAQKNKAETTIVVSMQKTTHSSSKLMAEQEIQHFLYSELFFPIIHHTQVPAHRKLSDDEAKQLLCKLKVTKEQLPRLHKTDPVVRFHGFRTSDVVEIVRNNGLQQKSVFYRLVVA